ncbi:MAG: guanylate kinase [Gammaproteobacteria bacterium]|nr:guanylate kinase [Gammaproteobacteria bacterium]
MLSAPSGAGKTSLARRLVARRPDVALAVSHTTRAQRPGETHGVDYYFVDAPEFEAMIADGRFIEHATVFGNYYGTSVRAIEALISRGKHAILEIDWQGARAVRRQFPGAKSVFVMPPSMQALEQRLRARRQDADEVIAERMRAAKDEMSHAGEYDYTIVNDRFDRALAKLEALLPVAAGGRSDCGDGRAAVAD